MLHVIESELQRVRRELTRLEAQAELLERLICLNDNEVQSGSEMPIVEVEPPPLPVDLKVNVDLPADPVSKESDVPVDRGANCRRWEYWEDVLIAKSGYESAAEFYALALGDLKHRSAGSIYQRYRTLCRKKRIDGLRLTQQIMPEIEPCEPAPNQPPTRLVDASERREVVLPTARKKGASFAEQLERVANGEVGITDVPQIRMPDPGITLGGVATGML